MGIIAAIRKMRGKRGGSGFRFGRSLVLLQSDDWGRVGVRDEEGREELCSHGMKLGERPYDLYSLETAEDVGGVSETLESLRDSAGQPACLEMNFVTANLDFHATARRKSQDIVLKPLVDGLPGQWCRPALYEAYKSGVHKRVFVPSLHGASHFCQQAVSQAEALDGERGDLLRILWQAETPYIYWRMPWVGYEYWDPNQKASERFLSEADQQRWISFAAESFRNFFGHRAISACAPGYRANETTARSWQAEGVRIAQNGPGALRAPHFDEPGLLHTYRSVDFEPALNAQPRYDDLLAKARSWFAAGLPFIVSVHSINFHSTLAPFRQRTLPLLREFLQALKKNFSDLLFVSSPQLLQIIETGEYESAGGRIRVSAKKAGLGVRV